MNNNYINKVENTLTLARVKNWQKPKLNESQKFSIIESSILSHLCAGLHANTLGNRFNLSVPILKKTLDSILK